MTKQLPRRPDAIEIGYQCPECKGQFSIDMQIPAQGPPVFNPPNFRCSVCPDMPQMNQSTPRVKDVSPIIMATTAPTLRAVKPNGGL